MIQIIKQSIEYTKIYPLNGSSVTGGRSEVTITADGVSVGSSTRSNGVVSNMSRSSVVSVSLVNA